MPRPRRDHNIAARAIDLRHNLTDAETKLWGALRSHQLQDVHFRRQYVIGSYIVDFCAPERKLVIEVDGGQHLDAQEYDAGRTVFLRSQGFRVLRFWNDEVLRDLDAVLEVILECLKETPS